MAILKDILQKELSVFQDLLKLEEKLTGCLLRVALRNLFPES